jgi:hypothetical protein
MITTPVRCRASVFERAATATVAGPWPVAGARLNHEASVVAVQAHSRAASTRSDPLPPLCTNVVAFELTVV